MVHRTPNIRQKPTLNFSKKVYVSINEFIEEKHGPKIHDGKTFHMRNTLTMFTCPHCDSVLGFGMFRYPR